MSDSAEIILTGGIASGKTLVSNQFENLGVPVIDTDVLAYELVLPGTTGLKTVVSEFGDDILADSGSLDRRALRERIFDDPSARERLESILHPLIWAEARVRLSREQDSGPYSIVVVPLYVEASQTFRPDSVVVVDVARQTQIERLVQRDGIDYALAEQMLAAQASRKQRLALADYVIDNNGSLEALERQVNVLHAELMERFGDGDEF